MRFVKQSQMQIHIQVLLNTSIIEISEQIELFKCLQYQNEVQDRTLYNTVKFFCAFLVHQVVFSQEGSIGW